jgi:hypothetical protein
MPLSLTEEVFKRFVPLIVTLQVSTGFGTVNELIEGAGTGLRVNFVVDVTEPFGVVTFRRPVWAEEGTVTIICVAFFFTNVEVLRPLNETEDALLKFVPLIVT